MVYPCDVFDPEAVLQTVHNEKCTALYVWRTERRERKQ